jgi:biopolymer transport protein ExbB
MKPKYGGGHPQQLYEQLAAQIQQGQPEQALVRCERERGIFARLFAHILQNRHRSTEELEKLVSMAGTREIQKLSQHVRGLGIIGNVTPLIGLLGTVVGMVKTFMKIADASGQVNPSLLAGGIWEALLTTAAGLTVAIPVVIMYHYFEGVTERFAMQMKSYSIECIDLVTRENSDGRI